MIQILIHLIGCLFTLWFVLDSWRFTLMQPLFFCFALLPFLVELYIIWQAVSLNRDIGRNKYSDTTFEKEG